MHELKKLYQQEDKGREEIFFAIICKEQTKVRLCKVSLDAKKKPVIVVKEQVLVTKAKKSAENPTFGTKLQ